MWYFLDDFRVLRNLGIKNGQRKTFIKAFNGFDFSNVGPKDVDEFREKGKSDDPGSKGIENHISLSSKLMMLANPWEIIPFDSRAHVAVRYKPKGKKSYQEYLKCVEKFRDENAEVLERMHDKVKDSAEVIEVDFKDYLSDITQIRKNRLLDKLMWVSGA